MTQYEGHSPEDAHFHHQDDLEDDHHQLTNHFEALSAQSDRLTTSPSTPSVHEELPSPQTTHLVHSPNRLVPTDNMVDDRTGAKQDPEVLEGRYHSTMSMQGMMGTHQQRQEEASSGFTGYAPSSSNQHMQNQSPVSMQSPAMPTRRPRAQTFHFGTHPGSPYETAPGAYHPAPQPVYAYPYPPRVPYQALPSPQYTTQQLPPLATVPEHSLPPMPPNQQGHMYTIHPPPRMVQMPPPQQPYAFPADQPHLVAGRRSPVPVQMTRQRSTSDLVTRPSTLYVDTGMARRPSVMSYSPMVSPMGTPTAEQYDPHMSMQAGTLMLPSNVTLSEQHITYPAATYLNPAHLSHPTTRRRAPSAPMVPQSYFHTPIASPTTSTHPLELPTVPLPSPADEQFKRHLLSVKFPDREAAIDFLKQQAKQVGFSVLVRTSRPDYVVIICNCGRRVKATEGDKKRKRKRKTAMTGCEWHVILFRRNVGHSNPLAATLPRMWEFRASSKMEHNHPMHYNDE